MVSSAQMPMLTDFLKPNSIDWALKHLEEHGDTDFLPPPFEIKAMRASWTGLKPTLQATNIAEFIPSNPLLVLAPNGDAAFRAVKQLSPFDSVLYAALAYEVADQIEAMRVPKMAGKVFSYRVATTPTGRLFDPDVTWRDFHRQSKEIAADRSYTHIVVADIADFYNHIYLHRVKNALEAAGVSDERSSNIEHFLMGLNAKNSRGLPIGPNASRLFAEAALHDVDAMLMRRGYEHVRYLDDFRIFVRSRNEAMEALHDLAYYLYTAHRLSLQSKKTTVLDRVNFVEKELFDTQEMAEASQSVQLWKAKFSLGGELRGKEAALTALGKTLVDLLERGVEKQWVVRSYDVGWIYRTATDHRLRALVPKTLKNLDRLVMVLPDVVRYLVRVTNEKNAAEVGEALYRLAAEGERSALPFVHMWVLHAFCERPELCEPRKAIKLANRTENAYRDRLLALLARAHKRADYVREQKEVVGNMGPWAQRAVLWAADCLTPDEARHWLEPYKEHVDPLLAAVAKAAKV